MNDSTQLACLEHPINGAVVRQRTADGYIDATAMCKAAGKRLNNYLRNSVTQEFLEELSSVTRIRVTELVAVQQGGTPDEQGTWAHPDAAIHLAQWLSPKFAVQVCRWVREFLTTGAVPGADALAPVVPVLAKMIERIESLEDRLADLHQPLPHDDTIRRLRYMEERLYSRELFLAEREARLTAQMEAVGRMLAVPAARPVRMSRDDKKTAVKMALRNPAFDGLGDGEVAARIGVSQSMYRKYRQEAQAREDARRAAPGERFQAAYLDN